MASFLNRGLNASSFCVQKLLRFAAFRHRRVEKIRWRPRNPRRIAYALIICGRAGNF